MSDLYKRFQEMLPQTDSYPPYLFTMMSLLREGDSLIEEKERAIATLEEDNQRLKDEADVVREENVRLLANEASTPQEEEDQSEEESGDGIIPLGDLLSGDKIEIVL